MSTLKVEEIGGTRPSADGTRLFQKSLAKTFVSLHHSSNLFYLPAGACLPVRAPPYLWKTKMSTLKVEEIGGTQNPVLRGLRHYPLLLLAKLKKLRLCRSFRALSYLSTQVQKEISDRISLFVWRARRDSNPRPFGS